VSRRTVIGAGALVALVAISITVLVLASRDTGSSSTAGRLVSASSIGRDDPDTAALHALIVTSSAASSRSETFVLDGQAVPCVQVNTGPFTCSTSADTSAATGVFGDATAELAGVDVVASDDAVFALPAPLTTTTTG